MDLDIMNQEESKLKPLASELDSSLITATTTGRDQLSNTTLRHRHPPFESFYSQQSSMDPVAAQPPPLVAPYMTGRKDSVQSPEDLSGGPSRSPIITYNGSRQASQSFYGSQEDDIPIEDDNEQDFGNEMANMELEDNGFSKPQLENRGPAAPGDLPKGSQKNFVFKLFQMLEDPDARAYIQWGQGGREFVVTNQDEFAPLILSKHFKHSNFSSFVRQLNMYDFHKTNRAPRSQRGTAQHQHWVFSHPRFQQNRPDLLSAIKRKANEGAAPVQYGEDQLQPERRPSFVADVRSPPNGPTASQEVNVIICSLQKQNQELHQRLQQMETGYKWLAAQVESLLKTVHPGSQSQSPLDMRAPVQRSMAPPPPQQPTSHPNHVQHYAYNVPSGLGAIANFQQQAEDDLTSPSTDSQSPVHQFRPSETSNSFVPMASESSRMQATVNNTLHNPPAPVASSLASAMPGGTSSYQAIQHQSLPVSLQTFTFAEIGSVNNMFNPGAPQFPGPSNENISPVISRTVPQSQGRIPLGSRSNPVMMTPAKGASMAAVPPKGQPPDSTGGLHR